MSKISGTQKRARRRAANQAEHERITAEVAETFRAYFVGWERKGGEYRRIIRAALRGRVDLALTLTYRQDRKSTLTADDLAVVLAAVDGFGESSGGISARRINRAMGFCGVGKSLAKIAPCLRLLNSLGLIDFLGGYKKGERGNHYRLTDACLLALQREPRTRDPDQFGILPTIKPALPMPTPKPKRRREISGLEVPQDNQAAQDDDRPF